MRRALSWIGMAGLASVLACQGDLPTGPQLDPVMGGGSPVTVMSQNMYVGADLDAVITALLGGGDPSLALAIAVGQVLGNTAEARIAALADNIAAERPQVVGLQEVSRIEFALPSPPFPAPVAISQDFLAELLAALAARGAEYRVAASNTNFTIDLTALFGAPVQLSDRDVLLVARGVEVRHASGGTFPCPLCLPLGLFTIQRGWVRADLRLAGSDLTVVSTHPESGADPLVDQIRTAQVSALAAMLAWVEQPIVLLGDLNDVPGSAMHAVLQQAGFVDLWAEAGAGPGWTCCRDPDLRGGNHSKRIDYVMVRDGFGTGRGGLVGGARVSLLDPALSSGGPLWRSDHAGLLARLPPARQQP